MCRVQGPRHLGAQRKKSVAAENEEVTCNPVRKSPTCSFTDAQPHPTLLPSSRNINRFESKFS